MSRCSGIRASPRTARGGSASRSVRTSHLARAKCGTTWMQTIVGMLLLDRPDLGAPIDVFSPWLDMLIYTDEEYSTCLNTRRIGAL